jgi:hypothetical protein
MILVYNDSCVRFACVAVGCVGAVLACDGLLVPRSSLLGGGEGLGYTRRWQMDYRGLWCLNRYSRGFNPQCEFRTESFRVSGLLCVCLLNLTKNQPDALRFWTQLV